MLKSSRAFRTIPTEVAKYLHWWQFFLLQYNGVSMISLDNWSAPDEIFSSDA
jgi:hypothetical protein